MHLNLNVVSSFFFFFFYFPGDDETKIISKRLSCVLSSCFRVKFSTMLPTYFSVAALLTFTRETILFVNPTMIVYLIESRREVKLFPIQEIRELFDKLINIELLRNIKHLKNTCCNTHVKTISIRDFGPDFLCVFWTVCDCAQIQFFSCPPLFSDDLVAESLFVADKLKQNFLFRIYCFENMSAELVSTAVLFKYRHRYQMHRFWYRRYFLDRFTRYFGNFF